MKSTPTSNSLPQVRAASDIAAAAREALRILRDADDYLPVSGRQSISNYLLRILATAQQLGGESREPRKAAAGLTYFADGTRFTGGDQR
jgi:hypothetical protein